MPSKLSIKARVLAAAKLIEAGREQLSLLVIEEGSESAMATLVAQTNRLCLYIKNLTTKEERSKGMAMEMQAQLLHWPITHSALEAWGSKEERDGQKAYLARTGSAIGLRLRGKTNSPCIHTRSVSVVTSLWTLVHLWKLDDGALFKHLFPSLASKCEPENPAAHAILHYHILRLKERGQMNLYWRNRVIINVLEYYLGDRWFNYFVKQSKVKEAKPHHLCDDAELIKFTHGRKNTDGERKAKVQGILTKAVKSVMEEDAAGPR